VNKAAEGAGMPRVYAHYKNGRALNDLQVQARARESRHRVRGINSKRAEGIHGNAAVREELK